MALIFPDPQARETVRQELTLDERVAYQYAIEGVYWRHRIWPKENSGPKPPVDAIVSQRQIEHKVEDYLRKSQSVADQRGLPITPRELHAELDRMAQHTRRPDVLREIFYALGNDPFVIAECLARPILAERLVMESKAGASPEAILGLDSETNREAIADSLPSAPNNNIARQEISAPPGCTDDTWTASSTVNGPDARMFHTAVWTGSEMIVWGGGLPESNTGGRYDPATDTWTVTNTANAPSVRWLHTAVWTGAEMIVWGGGSDATNTLVNTGGRYNPSADSWTATSTATAPAGRDAHTAIWSGSEMIVWGGNGCGGNCNLNTGGRYDPATDRWTATNTTNAPVARVRPTAVWTGSEMIIWGGSDRMHYLNTGGRYDPRTDSWTPTSLVGDVPIGRYEHTAVWTGDEMIVWGGVDESLNLTNTGGRYDPATDRWTATNTTNVPAARVRPTAVWTGSEMIVWGGAGEIADFNTGGRYNAGTDSWTPTTTANAPEARDAHTAVWTGSAMIVWGGSATSGLLLNTGGIYCVQSGPTVTPTPAATASATPNPTSTPTPPATPSPTPTTSASPTATPIPGARAINLSTRLQVGTGNDVGIGGFIVSGTGPRHLLLRGIGPSLSGSISDALPDPVLELHGPVGFQTITNNNWMDAPDAQAIMATGLAPANMLESAILMDLDPGAYTAILSGNGGVVGVGLVELYDLSMNQDSRLGNISTRASVGTGNDIVIGGFIIGGGTGDDPIILRGIGPSLASAGVSPLPDPFLELRNAQGMLIASDDNWMDDPIQKALIIAAGLAPNNNLESAIAATLMPGAYTALLSGVNNGTGVGLVEVYDHPTNGPTPTPTPGGSATPSPSPTGSATPAPTPGGGTPTPTPGTCTENFDGVTAPALPHGWVASNPIPGDGVMWVTATEMSESPPNNAFIADQDGISDKVLDRTGVSITSPAAMMSYRNNFNTTFSGGIYWDGYVLEVSAPNISGGAFLDITDSHVGGSFVTGGYTGIIDTTTGNPLAGRMAWSGNSDGYIDTVINLGPNLAGQTVTLRFRMGTDLGGAPGVRIDNISIIGASCH